VCRSKANISPAAQIQGEWPSLAPSLFPSPASRHIRTLTVQFDQPVHTLHSQAKQWCTTQPEKNSVHTQTHTHTTYSDKHGPKCQTSLGLARTICIRCVYGIFGREITMYTVIYGVKMRFWPTLDTLLVTTKVLLVQSPSPKS